MDQIYLKGLYGSNRIVPRYKFIKNISRSQKKLFTEPYRWYLREQYCSNVIVSRSEFTENVCKYNANQTIFDKDWLNWSKWTIRVNPYCPWLLIVRDILQYPSSRIVSWFELVRYFFKQYVHQTICAFIKNL